MEPATIDQVIMEDMYSPMDIYNLWDELYQVDLHFKIAFEQDDSTAKEYFQQMHFISDMIKARPLQEKQNLLEFFRRHNGKCMANNDFEAAAYFKESEVKLIKDYL